MKSTEVPTKVKPNNSFAYSEQIKIVSAKETKKHFDSVFMKNITSIKHKFVSFIWNEIDHILTI